MNLKHIYEHQAFCIVKPNFLCQNVYLHYFNLFSKYETLKDFSLLVLTFYLSFPHIHSIISFLEFLVTKTAYSRNTVLAPTTELCHFFHMMFIFVTEFINFSVRPFLMCLTDMDSWHKFVINTYVSLCSRILSLFQIVIVRSSITSCSS